MTNPIRTPDGHIFAVAAITVWSVSCGSLAHALRRRCFATRPHTFLPIYSAAMLGVASAAIAVLDLPRIEILTLPTLALAVPLGVGAGVAAVVTDAVLRHASRGRRGRAVVAHTPAPLHTSAARPTASFVRPDRLSGSVDALTGSLFPALLVSAAALEEVLFRGVLVELSLSLRSPALTATCLLASLLAFALTHVALGWAEVFAKLPLGALALISVLLLPSVVPAILAHVLFNLHAWRATT